MPLCAEQCVEVGAQFSDCNNNEPSFGSRGGRDKEGDAGTPESIQ